MVNEDRIAALRAQLNEPDPVVFKFEDVDDELIGEVRSLGQIAFRDKQVWQLVVDTVDGPFKLLLSLDLEKKLARERDVQPGDAVAMRFTGEGKNGYRNFKVAVNPDRPRSAAPAVEPWGYDDDDVPFPDPPYDED